MLDCVPTQTITMLKLWIGFCLGVLLVLLKILPLSPSVANLQPAPQPANPQPPVLQYRVESLPNAIVHTLTIPRQFPIGVALSPRLDRLEVMARSQNAVAALNGGFFDPVNQQSTSFVASQGEWVADPRQNLRLMENPDLARYLQQILDRSEFRQYQCGQQLQAAIVPHHAPLPNSCQLRVAVGGGPQLLPILAAAAEGFWDEAAGRDAIGLHQPNARTAIGLTQAGDVLWVMVAQRPEAPSASGMSLLGLADYLDRLGVMQALNLDGGSSSSFYYQGQTVYGKVDLQGNRVQRAVKSALLVQTASQ